MSNKNILLPEQEIPKSWYNVLPDLPTPLNPPLHPVTHEPITPDALQAVFPDALIEQEMSNQSMIAIPEDILDVYRLWRPTPLVRAYNLEKALKTPAQIYFKNEGVSPPGSHKPNTAIAQAYYNKKAGIKRLATETGAGQWGSALSFACNIFGLQCTVYMVKISYQQKPYRKSMMQVWGAECIASPSTRTKAGRDILDKYPDSLGSLGIAISEAMEDAAQHDDTKYALGSVLNHVLLHQSIIGLEVQKQFAQIGKKPDILIGCCGGGSNFAGLILPYVRDKIHGQDIRIIAVEPTACPTLTCGEYRYDFGDTAQTTPLLKMYTLGHDFVPPGIHAGGLRYHGMAPIVSKLLNEGLIEAKGCKQTSVFESAILFARTEGIIPAPETAHAIQCVVEEAKKCREAKEEKVIVFNFSGHGHFDLAAYDSYFAKQLKDYEYPEEKIREALSRLPLVEE